MSDVISTPLRSERLAIGTSLGCFALAGAANASIEAGLEAAPAVALAVAGVLLLARYARGVSRKRLAIASIALWIAFLGLATVHAIGVETVAAALPAPGVAAAIGALTWATLLAAGASTAFLGFREYGAVTGADSPEERVLDGGL